MTRLFLSLSLLFCSLGLSAQVIINEICASNLTGLADGDGDREDWFELYNNGPTAVNLSGWFLSDDPTEPQKWVIPNGQTIAAFGFRTIFCSGKDKVQGANLHTNFKLTQTMGESVVLTMPNGNTSDSYTFSTPNQTNHSYGRKPNGSATWKIFPNPTPGVNNNTSPVSNSIYAPPVLASQPGGFYSGSVTVSLSTDPGFTIRYTLTGFEPTASSTAYTGPINISSTKVLKAAAFSNDPEILPGFVTYHTYFINVNHSVPVVSIAGNAIVNLLNGSSSTPYGSFEYFVNNDLKADGYGEFNKHGNDSWAYPQRGIDWITRDQMGYDNELNYKFFKEKDRKKFQRLILKAAANDNYPFVYGGDGAHIRDSYVHTLAQHGGMNVDVRTHTSCVMYVNGQYWGLYDLREKADDADYTKYYYDQDEFDIDYIKTWGNTWQEYGSWTDWYTLKNFILTNNMTASANYAIAEQQLDFLSLIDYIIINQHTVCKDWLNWNTAWWRGRNPDGTGKKWRYALWDMDATFGHYANYTGIPDVGPNADPCDVEEIPSSGDPQNHIDIFMALYANPQFKALYVNRYADLLNTSLSCTYMNALLDSMINVIAPEMPQQISRWGGNINEWNQNVQTLHDFINTRCQILEPAIVDCYDVTGPYDLTVKISPATSPNHVKVNTITPGIYPYIGSYFGGINIDLVAQPAQGWQFDHWEVAGNTFSPDQLAAAIALAFQTTGEVTAFFIEIAPCSPPTNIAISTIFGTTMMDWTDQTLAMNYPLRYRKLGDVDWTAFTSLASEWDFDVLPGCTEYEVQILTACPQGVSDTVDYSFTTPDYLQGFALADADFCTTAGIDLNASFTGASYEWNDGSIAPTLHVSAPGDYWVTVELDGCTRIDTAHVSQNFATAAIQPALCEGESFSLGGTTFDALTPSGEVILPNIAANGCDSLVQVSLQFLLPSQSSIVATSCNPASVGVDTVYLTNAVGCDSLVITTTSFAALSSTFLTASSCNPNLVGTDTLFLISLFGCDSLVITTTSFDASLIPVTQLTALSCDPANVGLDTLTLTSLAGCDSLVITTTTLAPTSQTNLAATSCNPNFVGIDTLVLSNFYGCDSLVITTTTFDASAIAITQLAAQSCNPANVGVDTLTLTSLAGCDSLVITTTTLAPFSQTFLSANTCNPSFIGTDTLTLVNQFGCDSLIITTTSFDASAISITNLSAQNCDPALVGMDTLTLTSLAGCDSLVITTTTLAPTSQTNLAATSCNPNFVGVDTLVLSNFYGCDSLVITTTSFDASAISVTQLSAYACEAASVGVDTLTFTSFGGCDSLVVTTTTLAPSSLAFKTDTTCDPNAVGEVTQIFTNQWGCDSIISTNTVFVGLEFAAAAQDVRCFGENNGAIRLDTVMTSSLPVEFVLEDHSAQFYAGTPLAWDGLPNGAYSLIATNAYGCSATQTFYIADGPALDIYFVEKIVRMHLGDSVFMLPFANFNIATAEWSPTEGVACPTCSSTNIAPSQNTTYTLTVSDDNGCKLSTSFSVFVNRELRVYVPNAISLSSDNAANTRFTIFAGPDVANIRSLQLFDRWGGQVFEQNNLAPNTPSAWDGTYRGQLIQSGVLVWMAVVETIDGRAVNLSGDISVLR